MSLDLAALFAEAFKAAPAIAALVLVMGGGFYVVNTLGGRLIGIVADHLARATASLEGLQQDVGELRVALVEHVQKTDVRVEHIERRLNQLESK